jgi:hypothetical protein
MNEPRIYKNSPLLFIFMLLVFGVLFIGLVAAMGRETWYILLPFGLAFGVIFLVAILSLTSKTIIADDEISTQDLLGTKTLRWSEIQQVSGRGYRIKLHDRDRSITVSPSPQLPGYAEVIEWIGDKRPDLFDPIEYSEMSKSWFSSMFTAIFGLIIIGTGLFAYIQQDSNMLLPALIFALIGVGFILMSLAAPQTISIQGNSIMIRYLYKQKTLLADEISSVYLLFTQTRNGKQYFANLSLTNSKNIRISGFGPNLPVVYLVLRNWHAKNKQISNLSGRF